jgi:histone acetyltransferase
MPREYITRLVYDRRHDSLAIIKQNGAVIGGITYRLFPDRGFCEIVFCAISSSEQVKGFGAALMNQLKEQVRRVSKGQVKHYLTYADNYAIGYFKKQGFTREVTLDRSVWAGYIKDYDGGTLMQCTIVEGVDYLNIYPMLHQQKMNLVREIDAVTGCAKVYPGLPERAFPLEVEKILGLREAGWTVEMSKQAETPRRGRLYEMLRPLLNELQTHPAAWPFLKPVDREEVPSYYTIISLPMDLSTMDGKLEADMYGSLPEFIADFNLIIQNCRAFNDPDTSYCKNATNLEKFFKERLRARDARGVH